MPPKEKLSLTEMQRYVMHLRYRLTQYRLDGVELPEQLLNELSLAELLAQLDSKVSE